MKSRDAVIELVAVLKKTNKQKQTQKAVYIHWLSTSSPLAQSETST